MILVLTLYNTSVNSVKWCAAACCQTTHLVILDDLCDKVSWVCEICHDGHPYTENQHIGVLLEQIFHHGLHVNQSLHFKMLAGLASCVFADELERYNHVMVVDRLENDGPVLDHDHPYLGF